MPREATNAATLQEWRDLGFFYECDRKAKEWRLIGSRAGLLRFRDVLLKYVADPRNATTSEHAHFGPYAHLEVMTWPEPGVDAHAIHGSLDDLRRLAEIVEERLARARPGAMIRLDEFAADSEYALILSVRDDGFDPAAADGALSQNAG